MENYVIIKDFEIYSVSNLGNIKNNKSGHVLRPSLSSNGYYRITLCYNGKRNYKCIHRLVAENFLENLEDKEIVDHINNNRIDNRVENLRFVTNSENIMNSSQSRNNSSGVKGVSFQKNKNKWHAQICVNRVRIHIGLYETIEEAQHARILAARKYQGEYINKCENIKSAIEVLKEEQEKIKNAIDELEI